MFSIYLTQNQRKKQKTIATLRRYRIRYLLSHGLKHTQTVLLED